MANIKKIAVVSGITALVGALIYKSVQTTLELKAFYNQLSFNLINLRAYFDNKNFWDALLHPNLVIKADVEFINPTKTSVSFQKPVITLKYDGQELTKSKISKDIITIDAEGVSLAKDFTFTIDLYSKYSILIDIFKKVKKNINLDGKTTAKDKVSAIISQVSDAALLDILPLLECNILLYFGGVPIDYTTKLV